jgi:hypothetical protein
LGNAAYYFRLAYEEGNVEGAWRYVFCRYLWKGIHKNMAKGETFIWTAAQIGSFDALWISYILFGLPSAKFEILYNNDYSAALWQESCLITIIKNVYNSHFCLIIFGNSLCSVLKADC